MKKTALLLGVLLFLAGCSQAPTGKDLYGYSFDSAKISYQISGSSKGTSDVLIKNDKKVIKNQIVQTALDGSTNNINTTVIQNGGMIYSLDNSTKTGTALTNPLYAQLQKMSAADRQKKLLQEAVRTSDQDSTDMPQPDGEKQIAGQTCQLYKTATGTVCLWENIPLENTVSLPEFGVNLTTVASTIDLNPSIDDQEFGLPSDYKVTELK